MLHLMLDRPKWWATHIRRWWLILITLCFQKKGTWWSKNWAALMETYKYPCFANLFKSATYKIWPDKIRRRYIIRSEIIIRQIILELSINIHVTFNQHSKICIFRAVSGIGCKLLTDAGDWVPLVYVSCVIKLSFAL